MYKKGQNLECKAKESQGFGFYWEQRLYLLKPLAVITKNYKQSYLMLHFMRTFHWLAQRLLKNQSFSCTHSEIETILYDIMVSLNENENMS